jgi:hypothetical protein
MADGNLVRQSNVREGSVVFGPSVYELPLLPFEKELIKTIGITEEEYRKFAAEVRRKGVVRPAEYEHLPDVQATGVETYLVSLAVSLVITGVAYLLTPKPKMPEASKRSQLDLGSVNAGNRFTQSRGFDTLNELADYGAPVPIIFGLYDEALRVGGMLVTPKLVWSRMFSHGTQQSAKLMFVVGEQGVEDDERPDGIARPDLEGIFLGNNALDAIHEDFFAFYWKRNTTVSGNSRIRAANLVHGTQGGSDSGDPSEDVASDDDMFLCPSNVADKSPDFCHAYSPANNTQFGMFGAIPNGNGYRVNYETVPIIDGTDNKQARALTLRRIKIVGDKDLNIDIGKEELLDKVRKQDQEGEGRQYSPGMGLVKLVKTNNGGTITVDGDYPEGTLSAVVEVSANDELIFEINPHATKIPKNRYQRSNNRGGESVDDINSTVEAEQIAVDAAMQLGERFAIGNTVWKVIDRALERYEPDDDKNQFITLRCLDSDESRQRTVGLVSRKNVIQPNKHFIGDESGVGAAFFPLTSVATGLVRNNRPAVVTEIGLRSKVFQRLNGICAFNTIPTPNELDDFEDEEVQVRSGTFTGAIKRSSVFQVFVRQAGLDENGDAFIFQRIDFYFVVTGSRPVDQYNFIRFVHPQDLSPTELEFKFVGIPASELRSLSGEHPVMRLSASADSLVRKNADVPGLGSFGIVFAGTESTKSQIKKNKEFIRNPRQTAVDSTADIPQSVARSIVLPQDTEGDVEMAEAIHREANISNSSAITSGKNGAFFHEIFGSCDNDPINVGGVKTLQTRESLGASKWIVVKWTVQKTALPDTHYARARQNNRVLNTWAFVSCDVVGSSDQFKVNDVIEFKRGLGSTEDGGSTTAYTSSNPFALNHPDATMTFSGQRYRVTDTDRQANPAGRTQAYYYELLGDAGNLNIGQSKTIQRSITVGSKTIKLKMTSTVRDLGDHFSGETQGWNHPGIQIPVVQDSDTTGNWNQNETFEDLVSVSSGNPFVTAYSQVGFRYIIGDIGKRDVEVIYTGDTEFESQSQYADMSLYRSLVQKSNESEPEHSIVYVNEVMPNVDEDGESRAPQYNNLTIAGLSLKASRNFVSLDQMRVWLGSGLHVKRLHPDLSVYNLGEAGANGDALGPSNLFTDLVFYMLTDDMGGAGQLLKIDKDNPKLLNQDDFVETSRFLHAQKLFFNGVVGDRTNLRQYITDVAPYFLCNFVIMDGKFSLKPAIPHMADSGQINLGPVPIEQLFTAGNILEDSYTLEYLRSEERRPFKAVMRYRQETKNKLPEEKVVEVKLPNQEGLLPQEQFDLTQFCTSEEHAIKVAKYFLGIRKLVSHTISFSTTVHGLNLRAGSYIKVITTSSPYSTANNGTISSAGAVTSVEELADGTYNVSFFKTGSEDVEDGEMQVSGGQVADSTFHDSVFTIKNETVSQNVYVVEQLTFSEEGTVDIVASEHPCDDDGVSELAKLVAGDSVITIRS